jgi:hypothetical protein
MKALIVETDKKYAAALLSDGSIIKVPKRDYAVGQEVSVAVPKRHRRGGLVAAAACFMLLATGGAGYATVVSPYSHVTLDVNPSIEYTLNRFDQVVSIDCMNDEGQEIVNNVSQDMSKFASFEDVFRRTVDELYRLGYLTGDEHDYMVLSVCCDKNSSKAAAIENSLSAITSDYTLTSEVIEVTEQDRADASDLNTTAGKLALILDVVSKEDSLTESDVKDFVDKSVKQIAQTIDTYKKDPAETASESEKISETTVSQTPASASTRSKTTDSGTAGKSENKTDTSGSSDKSSKQDTTVIEPEPETPAPSDNDDIDDSRLSGPSK